MLSLWRNSIFWKYFFEKTKSIIIFEVTDLEFDQLSITFMKGFMVMEAHKPFVAAEKKMKDFNLKTVVLGVILGAVFGSANAYLGLLVGLTISTAIPLAVVSVAILRILTPVFGRFTSFINSRL